MGKRAYFIKTIRIEIMRKTLSSLAMLAGVLFIMAGAFKALAASPGESLLTGRRAFAQMLDQLDVPLPFVAATAIPVLEIIGGIGLIRGRGARLWAALLALDMIGAIFLVGLPGRSGEVLSIGDTKIGGEPWRLPLEIALLLLMVWLVVFPIKRKSV